jgi:hypothetical protein
MNKLKVDYAFLCFGYAHKKSAGKTLNYLFIEVLDYHSYQIMSKARTEARASSLYS